MNFKADFYHDWLDMLKNKLESWDYDISNIEPNRLSLIYFDGEKKRPSQKPRRVEVADSFLCPKDLQSGWDRFKFMIESGQNILPNLSKLIQRSKQDMMLNHWGVHHFHLGDKMKGEFVVRTGPLLFALVTHDVIYAIGVFKHDGDWANKDIVEIMHRNWPSVIAQYLIKGNFSEKLSTEEYQILRKKNCNSFVRVADSATYALGGVMSSGNSLEARIWADKAESCLKNLQNNLQSWLKLHEYGEEVEAKLENIEGGCFEISLTLKKDEQVITQRYNFISSLLIA